MEMPGHMKSPRKCPEILGTRLAHKEHGKIPSLDDYISNFSGLWLAGEPGFEPRSTESESAVLPLNYSPAEPAGWRRGQRGCVTARGLIRQSGMRLQAPLSTLWGTSFALRIGAPCSTLVFDNATYMRSGAAGDPGPGDRA